jgi:hypothetical protein
MWQAESFDPEEIDKEFEWAEGLGMNTMRVFLHDLLWQQDAPGFQRRIDTFLTIASRHHIRPILVLFDSCWDPNPKVGSQHPPIPGVHNSGWVQSPGAKALADPTQESTLRDITWRDWLALSPTIHASWCRTYVMSRRTPTVALTASKSWTKYSQLSWTHS